MKGLTHNDITMLFLSIALMMFVGRLLGEILRKYKQPMVIGEILAGIILGPTVLGTLAPDTFEFIFKSSNNAIIARESIATLGVVMLLLVSGLEVDLSIIFKQTKSALKTSMLGMSLPFAIGFGAAYFFPQALGIMEHQDVLIFSLFVGTALSITALPVVAKTLLDLNLFKTDVGFIIIASAMVDDLLGWIIFAIILNLIGVSAFGLSFTTTLLLLFSFITFTLFVGRRVMDYLFPIIQRNASYPGGVLNFILIQGFIAAAFTEFIGVHAIFGAFIMGIALGDSRHLKEETKEIINQFITNIFAPIFFVSIGLKINFITGFNPWIVSVFLVLAIVGKVVGGGLGAYWGGLSKFKSLTVGFGINSRGAMEIVLGMLAFNYGLIHEEVFVALVIMALVTSMSSGTFMSYFMKKDAEAAMEFGLFKRDRFFITAHTTKSEVVFFLAERIAGITGLPLSQIVDAVNEREELLPTGIQNYLAIPHARLQIDEPVVVTLVNKNPIDFGALDDLPSQVISMIVTPVDQPEVQLQLLSQLSKAFAQKSDVEKLVKLSRQDAAYAQFISMIKATS